MFELVNVSISATYGHTWTTSHEFDESMTATVPPKTKVCLDDAPQMLRDTGNFTITLGNTTIHVTHVYFDSPDPDGNGNWTLMSQSIDGSPIHRTVLHQPATATTDTMPRAPPVSWASHGASSTADQAAARRRVGSDHEDRDVAGDAFQAVGVVERRAKARERRAPVTTAPLGWVSRLVLDRSGLGPGLVLAHRPGPPFEGISNA
jgi:hypothetical protein